MGVSARFVPGEARSRRGGPARRGRVGARRPAAVTGSMRGTLASIEKFASRTIVVIGDLITDEYLFGKPVRISREAPVLILSFSEREVLLGGAANAAHNVHALGARVVPIGVIGRDAAGEGLAPLLRGAGISAGGLVADT